MATVVKPAAPPIVPRIAPREDLNPFRIAQIQFDMAAEFLKLDAGLRQVLRTPKRVLEVSLSSKMDNGQLRVMTGYRVQHNVSRGLGKGGIRFHPNVTLDEVKALVAWIMDTYSMMMGHTVPGVVTGKPISIGGSLGRAEATARGLLYVVEEACKLKKIPLRGATVAIQGFGNAGATAARLFVEKKAKVIALSDTRGGVTNSR